MICAQQVFFYNLSEQKSRDNECILKSSLKLTYHNRLSTRIQADNSLKQSSKSQSKIGFLLKCVINDTPTKFRFHFYALPPRYTTKRNLKTRKTLEVKLLPYITYQQQNVMKKLICTIQMRTIKKKFRRWRTYTRVLESEEKNSSIRLLHIQTHLLENIPGKTMENIYFRFMLVT